MTRKALDVDGDGVVTREEFVDVAPKWIAMLDRDNDGVVTPGGFRTSLKRNRRSTAAQTTAPPSPPFATPRKPCYGPRSILRAASRRAAAPVFGDRPAMKINGNEIRPGNIIEHNDGLWVAVKIQHVKPGKGGAFAQVELQATSATARKLNERFRLGG